MSSPGRSSRRSFRGRLRALLVLVAVTAALACSAGPERPAPATASASATAAPNGNMSFAVLGDFGTGGAAQRAVARRMCAWRRNHPFDVVITTGDNVYPDGDPSRFKSRFVRPYRCLRRHGVRFHASLGNHDAATRGGDPEVEDDRFGMPAHNYVLRLNGVRFVVADSNSLDRSWLRRALRARSGDKWTVVVFHYPVYSPGTGHGSTPGYRPSLPRLFRRRGVDLVLNGHDHMFAVTKNLRGIRYVVTGGGGAELYGCSHKSYAATCKVVHHFLYVTAGSDRINVTAVPSSGRPVYHFSTTGRG